MWSGVGVGIFFVLIFLGVGLILVKSDLGEKVKSVIMKSEHIWAKKGYRPKAKSMKKGLGEKLKSVPE